MIVRDVQYAAEGRTMIGRLAMPEGNAVRPGVLIAHEANGLDDYQRSRVERFAELGYVGFAIDYHGGGSVFTDRDEMMSRVEELTADPDRIRALARAGLDALIAEPAVDPDRVAVIGYCLGGMVVLELARSGANLRTVVGFHPGLNSPRPGDSAHITGRVLICVGADDHVVTRDQRSAFEEEMRSAGVEWQMNLYGGVKHSFTHPNAAQASVPGLEYNAEADRMSWRAMNDFLKDSFSLAPTTGGSRLPSTP